MSETSEAVILTDADGRKLEVRKLDALEQLDLFEAAGPMASNAPWLGTATVAACVRAIDGVPVPFPRTRNEIRALVKRLGHAGQRAVQPLYNDEADAREDAELAKN